jgi:hypothetical protein
MVNHTMSFEWLRMRIQEEEQRRRREADTLQRLPRALEELHAMLAECVADYRQSFGDESADVQLLPASIAVTVREQNDGRWQTSAKVAVTMSVEIPGFRVECGEYSLAMEVGLLPNDKLFYRDCEQDKYLTLEDVTRRILDRAMFPKLRE